MTNGKRKAGKKFRNDIKRSHRKAGPGTAVYHKTKSTKRGG